jgi:hypothetical protein
MKDSDDLRGDDPAIDKIGEKLERHRAAIYERIYDYMEEAQISEAYVAQLLVDAMIRMRMAEYGLGVESPSVAGLKLDLDRLRSEVGECVREAKKDAEGYIRHVKDLRARAEDEDEDEENSERPG